MAINNTYISWDDITAIYQNLNTQRNRFSFPQVTIPQNPGPTNTNIFTNNNTGLISLIQEMKNNTFLFSINLETMNPPNSQDIMLNTDLNSIQNNINIISQVPIYSSNNGQPSHSVCNGKSFSNTNDNTFVLIDTSYNNERK